jgi:hypothetical protein
MRRTAAQKMARRFARSGSRFGSMCNTIFATSCQSAPTRVGVEQVRIGDEVLLVVARQTPVNRRNIIDRRLGNGDCTGHAIQA